MRCRGKGYKVRGHNRKLDGEDVGRRLGVILAGVVKPVALG